MRGCASRLLRPASSALPLVWSLSVTKRLATSNRAAVPFGVTAPVSQSNQEANPDDWTVRLTPFLDATQSLLLHTASAAEGVHVSHGPAEMCKHTLSTFVTVTEETCRAELLTAAPSATLPSVDALAASMRLLVFVQCVASLLDDQTFCALPDAAPYLPTLRNCAIATLQHYGPAMIAGRTARGIRGLTQTELAHVPPSDGRDRGDVDRDIVGCGEDAATSLALATLLLDATSAVLRLSPNLDHCSIATLRALLKPALLHVGQLTIAELCELTLSLAKTSRASIVASDDANPLESAGTLSFEEHADFVALCGEVVRRAEAQVVPASRARKEFSKSSAFTFSLKEKKERARLELEDASAAGSAPTDHHFTIGDLSDIATALAVVRFHDGSFATAESTQSPSSSSPHDKLTSAHHVWHAIATTTVHLVESEMAAVSPPQPPKPSRDTSSLPPPLSVSFSKRDLQSICFACDRCCQQAAYDMVMQCLVRVGIVGAYIPAPSVAARDAMRAHGTTVD